MCLSPFSERVISLPDVKLSTFCDFLAWLHSCTPQITIDYDIDSVIDLAIFSETYQIHSLKNQTSDAIQNALRDGNLRITPEIMSQVYGLTPDGSILRELFSFGFALRKHLSQPRTSFAHIVGHSTTWSPDRDASEWEKVFEQFATFGRDYFRYSQLDPESVEDLTGNCRFHDHSNIVDWDKALCSDYDTPCPYPHGAPVSMPKGWEIKQVGSCIGGEIDSETSRKAHSAHSRTVELVDGKKTRIRIKV
jgi:hypothetical protein